MNYEIVDVMEADVEELAQLRISAMQDSLEAIGRFDPQRARNRFVDNFSEKDTNVIQIKESLAGFYVFKQKSDHLYLEHLYVHPRYQGMGIGGRVLKSIKELAKNNGLAIRLGALRGSRSNNLYLRHGFKATHEEDWDIYYEYKHSDRL